MIVQADARRIPLRSGLVQTVVTSPPYWGLRDYGLGSRGIGVEATRAEYLAALVAVFREVRRILRPDGTVWLNLGDSYNSCKGGLPNPRPALASGFGLRDKMLKQKDLLGLPWRLAFALQDDGWYLRAEIIWAKPNPMPESVIDRPTRSHETVFVLASAPSYYYDADAIREPHLYGDHPRHGTAGYQYQSPGQCAQAGLSARRRPKVPAGWDTGKGSHRSAVGRYKTAGSGPHVGGRRQEPEPGDPGAFHPLGRNRRDVWTIPTEPFRDAHFATMPRALVEPCILAGSRPGDLVFDPFGGSGTVAKVAVGLGRRACVADLSADYCGGVARRRLASTQRGLPLGASA